MRGKIVLIIGILLVSINGVFSQEHVDFSEAKELIEIKVNCDELTDEQLDLIGDYFMEQMHPGEAHELMDKMMGGEGSDSLKQMHIQMARRLYCNEDVGGMMGSSGMMGSGMMGSGMMGGGMMGSSGMMGSGGMIGSGMMGSGGFWSPWNIFWIVFWILILIGLVLLVVWLFKKVSGKKDESAIELLRRRYAKGELTKKQFEEMKKELEG